MICRRIRMTRKANLQDFNFFVTFTYDDKLHTEESFRQKMKNCLSLLSSRKSWKYIGVWERSPEKKRLYFHGILDIPEGTMPGYFVQKEDYSFTSHRRQIANQDTYFLENFGRNDFEKIVDQNRIGEAMAYLMKYLEKSGGAHRLFKRAAAIFYYGHYGRRYCLSDRNGRTETIVVR